MRVLYVIDSLVPAGAEQSLVAMLGPLAARGVEPVVAHLSDAPGLQDRVDELGVSRIPIRPTSRREAVSRLRAVITDHRPDLVHTTLFESDIAGRIAAATTRTPVVSTLANVAYGRDQQRDRNISGPKLAAAWAADASTARLVRRFHAVSGTVAEVMARRLLIPLGRIDVVHRGRDPVLLGERTEARRAATRERLGISPADRVVLAVGRHEYQKGLDVLLDAHARIDRRPLVLIAGREGNQSAAIRTAADLLGDGSVRLLGPRGDVADLMVAADLGVFPSRWEGMPGAVIEALALQLPVIASDIPQHREALGEVSVALVPPDRPAELASALRTALSQPAEELAAPASAGRRRFEQLFTIAYVASQMVELYRRACGANQNRTARRRLTS